MAKLESQVVVLTDNFFEDFLVEYEDEGDDDNNIEMAMDLAAKEFRNYHERADICGFIVDGKRIEV